MHILLITHYFQPENVAPQRRWDELARRFISSGHEVTVLCPPPHHPKGRVPALWKRIRPGIEQRTSYGARVIRTAYLRHRGDIITRTADHLVAAADATMRARARLRASPPDVVVATAPGLPSLIAGRQIARSFHAPLISEMRDAWPDLVTFTGLATGAGLVGMAKRQAHSSITSWQKSAARVVVTTSRFAEILEQRGIRRPAVIRNGTVLDRFEAIPVPAHSSGLRVLYMGNMGRSQGLDSVVRVAAHLRQAGAPLHVRFVGHGAARTSLRRLNEQLGGPVEILDEVPADQVFPHYAWADSLLVSLRAWEPFEWTVPSKLYESLATGKHVTGILAGEAAEVLSTSAGGDVVRPGDTAALEALWLDLLANRSRLEVGSLGRRWIERNASYDRLAEDYLAVLREAVDSHHAGP